MEKLNEELDKLVARLSDSKCFKEEIESVKSVYPFSRYEYIISKLLVNKTLTYEQYIDLRGQGGTGGDSCPHNRVDEDQQIFLRGIRKGLA